MITANDKNKIRIIARDSIKTENYFCPVCDQDLIIKQGEIKIWHFAHKYNGNCWWPSQSEEHLLFKEKIYDLYTSMGYSCTLEKIADDKKSIIDVEVIDKKGNKIAVEIQLSIIPLEKIIERTNLRTRQGYYTLWLLGGDAISLSYNPITDEFSNGSGRTTGMMWLMHSKFYFGRVYIITRNFLSRAHFNLTDPDLEIGALYLIYQTKTIILKRIYIPIQKFELLLIGEEKGLKLARFYDKHYKKDEV